MGSVSLVETKSIASSKRRVQTIRDAERGNNYFNNFEGVLSDTPKNLFQAMMRQIYDLEYIE